MRRREGTVRQSESAARRRFAERVGAQEHRKLRAVRRRKRSVWLGLGVLGFVGWSVATPPVVGAFVGAWMDRRWPVFFSWTLLLLLCGLVFGCANVWLWINHERREILDDEEPEHEQ